MDWDVEVGSTIRRVDLHTRYGGRGQGGIGPSAQTSNVFIFSDPSVGQQHGYYDYWEGDTFHYTGEGQRGPQEMIQGNRAIRDHAREGRALRLFDGVAGEVTYIGEVTLDEQQPWYVGRAPETGGGPLRDVIVFRLVPVGPFWHRGNVLRAQGLPTSLLTPYRQANEDVSSVSLRPLEFDPETHDRGTRGHATTQNALELSRDLGDSKRSPQGSEIHLLIWPGGWIRFL